MTLRPPLLVEQLRKPDKSRSRPIKKPLDWLRDAIALAGSQRELAIGIGCSQQNISRALAAGRVSVGMAIRIENYTRGRVRALSLCPTLFVR